MFRISKKTATFLILSISIGLIFGLRFCFSAIKSPSQDQSLAKVKGKEDAPIQIVEFIDFQCPACAKGAKHLKKIIEDNSDKIRLELKYYPLSVHQHGLLSAQYAECAARQDKFWVFQDYLIDKQKYWEKLKDVKPTFELFAEWSQLDPKDLKNCLEDKSVEDVVSKDKAEGKILGVKSTPTYFINDKMFVGFDQLEAELKRLLNENNH